MRTDIHSYLLFLAPVWKVKSVATAADTRETPYRQGIEESRPGLFISSNITYFCFCFPIEFDFVLVLLPLSSSQVVKDTDAKARLKLFGAVDPLWCADMAQKLRFKVTFIMCWVSDCSEKVYHPTEIIQTLLNDIRSTAAVLPTASLNIQGSNVVYLFSYMLHFFVTEQPSKTPNNITTQNAFVNTSCRIVERCVQKKLNFLFMCFNSQKALVGNTYWALIMTPCFSFHSGRRVLCTFTNPFPSTYFACYVSLVLLKYSQSKQNVWTQADGSWCNRFYPRCLHPEVV